MPNWDYEERAAAVGYAAVCGVDEAGAGPLAGPVYAAAVMLPRGAARPQRLQAGDGKAPGPAL